MRCPVCGAKLVAKQICPYCKVTDEQIINASNKKVKEYRKSGNKDMIHYTNIIPSDLSRLKIVLYTIFLGLLGVNYFYIQRPIKGTFALISSVGSFLITIATITVDKITPILNYTYQILMIMMCVNLFIWFGDIIACIFRTFKVPVVLARKEKKE